MAQKCVSLKHSKNKSEISPDKKLLIQQMLCERIKSEQDTETNQFKRRERFGKLLSNAIYDNNRKAKNAAKSTVSQCSEHICKYYLYYSKQKIQQIIYVNSHHLFIFVCF